MIGLILKELIGGAVGFFKDKAAIKKATVAGKIKLLQSASQNTADWEALHAKGSQTSWKDEWWTIVWSVPLIHGYYEGGFEAIEAMPDWYTYTLMTMVLASFGIRVTDVVKRKLGR